MNPANPIRINEIATLNFFIEPKSLMTRSALSW
jgi:hypothetical protein